MGKKIVAGWSSRWNANFVCLCVYLCVCVSAHVRCVMSIGLGCTINRPTEEQHYDNCPLFSCHGNANGIH